MTVGELLAVSPRIVQVDIEVRANGDGQFIYKYAIAPYIQIYSGYPSAKYNLDPKERLDFKKNTFPATFWAIDPRKAKEVLDLEIKRVTYSTAFHSYLYENSDVNNYTCATIKAYPKGWVKPIELDIKADLKNQMSIFDFKEGV